MVKNFTDKIGRICDTLIEVSFYIMIPSVTFSTSLVEISVTTMICAWIIKRLLDRDFTGINTLPVKILGVGFLWVLLSCFNSSYFHESFRGIFKVLEAAFIFIVVSSELRKERHFRIFLYVLFFTVLAVCLDGIYQHYAGVDLIRGRLLISRDYLRRISASFVHPNSFGIFLFMVSSMTGAVMFSGAGSIKVRLLMLSPFILSVYCLFLTRSRGAWLSFMLSAVVIAVFKSRKTVVAVLAVLLLGALVMPAPVKRSLEDAFDITSGTARERVMLWEGTINMIKEHPLLGFGINTYSRNFPDYKPKDYADYRYSHNCYLQMASEIGIPGALLFIIFFLSVLEICRRRIICMGKGLRKGLVIGIFGSLVGFLAGAMVDTHLYSVVLSMFFYVLLGFCYAQAFSGSDRQNI